MESDHLGLKVEPRPTMMRGVPELIVAFRAEFIEFWYSSQGTKPSRLVKPEIVFQLEILKFVELSASVYVREIG
ncbi:hypothetical protein AGR5A_Lc100043 [Agrobacterium genomosp. 5 str. CFBP 6626]|nr:hypothetical protein AGR5A_Lc100043 [Agrobacterium genomosp. 5 str. CFBP 6626]